MPRTLNTSNYHKVWSDDFTGDTSLDRRLFPVCWGDPSEFSFSDSGLTLTSDGTAAGFETADYLGPSSSYGYGLYQITFTMPTNQAAGAYICLWPATNIWPGPEIDLAEQLNHHPYLTVHWQGAGNTNQYQSFFFTADLSKPTTIAVDWEHDSLTFYINALQVVQYTSGGPVPIPKDYAEGGQNEAFGIGNVGPAGTSLTVSQMSYSTSIGGTTSSRPGARTSTMGEVTNARGTTAAPAKLVALQAIARPTIGGDEQSAESPVSGGAGGQNICQISSDSLGQNFGIRQFESGNRSLAMVDTVPTLADSERASSGAVFSHDAARNNIIRISGPGVPQSVGDAEANAWTEAADYRWTEFYPTVLNTSGSFGGRPTDVPSSAFGIANEFQFAGTRDRMAASDPLAADEGTSSSSVVNKHAVP